MDDHKDSEDLTIGMDGKMSAGATATTPAEEAAHTTPTQQSTNDIAPPPDDTPPTDVSDNSEQIPVRQASQSVPVEAPATDDEAADTTSQLSEDAIKESTSAPSTPFIAAAGLHQEPVTQKDTATTNADKHHARNNRKLLAIVVLLAAILLAVAVVYVYLTAQNNTEQSESLTQPATTQQQPATEADVDQASQEVDEALNALDDASDFDESQLSDEALGLQ